MSMFPGANAQVYYNSDGEPVGWDTHYDDEPDYDDYYENYIPDDDEEDDDE